MKKLLITILLATLAFFPTFNKVDADSLVGQETFENVVIFIRFADEEDYQAPYSLDFYEGMFNGTDQMSLKDYYLKASYNQLTINSILTNDGTNIVYYTDIYDRSYFEPKTDENPNGSTEGNATSREHNLLKRAINYVDENNLIPDNVNLDVNNDGEIDSVTFMVSGQDTGWNSLLWPHKWELYTFVNDDETWASDAPTINGKYAYTYTFELLGNGPYYDNRVEVGVLAHETFHLIGAPDLYHYYSYNNISPVGDWGLMDGSTLYPSHMLGYMKYRYGGWITDVTEITEPGTYTLYPQQDSPDNLYKIYTGYANEWVYLEYRNNEGIYEENLDDTGLIVYRVNDSIEGNVDGSFNEAGHAADEVFLFRPYMDDIEEPIVVIDVSQDANGDLTKAAISQNNPFTEMGVDTDIQMFSSYGKIIDLRITNVIEENGAITFDVEFTPSVNINTNDFDYQYRDLVLWDHESMFYTANIDNLCDTCTAYYTLNGETPTMESTLYNGEDIRITADSNQVIAHVYKDGVFQYEIKDTFTFSETIESAHDPYGNLKDITWYLEFASEESYDVIFDDSSEFEVDYDYLHVFDGTDTLTYTGTDLQNEVLTFDNSFLFITLDSDPYVDEMFGFAVEIELSSFIGIKIEGETLINHPVNTTYTDEGAVITGENTTGYTIETTSTVVDSELGSYSVTYTLLDPSNNVVQTQTRLIYVIDDEAPSVTLLGEGIMEVQLNSDFVDPYLEIIDNYDSLDDITVEVRGTVDTTKISTVFLTYVITDTSGNQRLTFRTVKVVDTTAPSLTLNPSLDTITEGDTWTDLGAVAEDNSLTELDIVTEGVVDTMTPGVYDITYTVTDPYDNVTVMTRKVTVVEKEEDYEITCDAFTSSTPIGRSVTIGDCAINGETMEKNTDAITYGVAGTYEVVYTKTINEEEYTYRQYVYVYDETTTPELVLYFERRRQY